MRKLSHIFLIIRINGCTLTRVLTLLAILVLYATVITAAPGDLDPTFGSGGKVITTGIGGLYDIAIQPDGKTVAVGGARIVRYNANGSLDSSFGEGGIVLIPTGVGSLISLNSVVIQADGKIVIAGEDDNLFDPYSTFLIRLDPNGTFDTTFNSGSTTNGGGDSVGIQADGKLLSCGFDGFSSVVRYLPNGDWDTSFNGTGGVVTPDSSASSLAIQADGKILVAGSRGQGFPGQFAIFRFNTDGSRDTSFGTNGTVTPTFAGDSYARKLAIQADGKILAAGVAGGVQLMVRFDPNGSPDTTFGNNGVVNTNVFSGDIAIQADGKIVAVGSSNDDFGVARYNSNGTLDTTFGGDGLVSTNLGGLDGANAVAIQPDGKIVAGGSSSNWYFALARYQGGLNANIRTRFDFDGDGRADLSVFRPASSDWYLNRSTDGLAGFRWGVSSDKIAPADYDGDGKTDVAVYRPSEGRWYLFNSSTGTFSVSSWGVTTDIPTPGDFDNDGRDDVAIFRPADGNWWISRSTDGTIVHQFGQSGDHPVVGDYDGDGRSDIALLRPSDGVWYINRSTAGITGYQFGLGTDKAVPADYDGDGKTDIAVYRPSEGKWYIVNSGSPTHAVYSFGTPNDIPTPADYDGDGRADIAIFRPSDGNWWINRTTAGLIVQQFGQNGDRPTPGAYGN